MLIHNKRYLQIAFNQDISVVERILPLIPESDRIIIEAGTPFIKREGISGIQAIKDSWSGHIVADLKTSDGAIGEVALAYDAGATAATVLGSSPTETLNSFVQECKKLGMNSMIDMLGVEDPLKVLFKLKNKPDVVILHKGRDEESTKGKVIPYKQVNKIKSKYNVMISAAGGVDLKEARSAIFNGANIVVVNVVTETDFWKGLETNEDISEMARKFLSTIQ
ncbi:hypothetical protein HY837_00320 [archaeon]|nr:hypothetical protein [archaeon]